MESADERCTPFPHRTMADPAAADTGSAVPHNPELSLDQVAIIGVTSGSTYRPTMHAKSWGVLERRSRAAAQVFGLGSDGTGLQRPVVASVSPTHMYGMETAVCCRCTPVPSPGAPHRFFPAMRRPIWRARR